ncbi:RraA family protein [Peptoniphilus sp. MSJ-1]|uniref:Regulator of ribonuclease activity homolog n=1 Tax=Peptoniphilus ovalis TaxID=2841503 RepID=A0ABS6FG92_9FIRM|nr:RraA family protein [Peptoniphilus ovalis]
MNSLLQKLKDFSTPEICDAVSRKINLNPAIKQVVGNKKIVGKALTVDVPYGEGLIVTNAIEKIQKGDVIVISGKGNIETSYWGDHRSICAKFMKAEAVVIDGAMRDIDACEEVGFPIFARGITPRTANKTGEGSINVEINCGGINISPGDIIFCDRNGVIALKPDEIQDAIEKALDKRKNEEYTINKMFETGKVLPRIIKRNENGKNN